MYTTASSPPVHVTNDPFAAHREIRVVHLDSLALAGVVGGCGDRGRCVQVLSRGTAGSRGLLCLGFLRSYGELLRAVHVGGGYHDSVGPRILRLRISPAAPAAVCSASSLRVAAAWSGFCASSSQARWPFYG